MTCSHCYRDYPSHASYCPGCGHNMKGLCPELLAVESEVNMILKTILFVLGMTAIAFLGAGFIFWATAQGVGWDRAARLPGGAFGSGMATAQMSAMWGKSLSKWRLICMLTCPLAGIGGHFCFVNWVM